MTQPGPDPSGPRPEQPEAIRAVPVRHVGRWISAAIILVLVAQLLHWLVTNPTLRWDVVGKNLFSDVVIRGVEHTIELTIIAMVMGIIFGVILAVMRLSANPVV